MSFAIDEKVWYKRNNEVEPEKAKFILQKGQNTTVQEKKVSQYKLINLEPGSSLKKCLRRNTRKLRRRKWNRTKYEESGNDVTGLEGEDRPRSPLKRIEEQIRKWHRPSRVLRRSVDQIRASNLAGSGRCSMVCNWNTWINRANLEHLVPRNHQAWMRFPRHNTYDS